MISGASCYFIDTSHEIGTHKVDIHGNVNTTWVNQTTKTSMPVVNGAVSGTITHTNNGTGIPRVSVKLSQDATVLASTTTDSNGNFLLSNLSPGTYTLTTSKSGSGPTHRL